MLLRMLRILVAAFDKAWEAVQASGVIYPEDKVELVRAILAKHIIAAAKDGEREHGRGALLALAGFLSPSPRSFGRSVRRLWCLVSFT
jgi:hypothetical protein